MRSMVEGAATGTGASGRPLPSPNGATFPRKREKDPTALSLCHHRFNLRPCRRIGPDPAAIDPRRHGAEP